MTRLPENPVPAPAVTEEESRDSLFERWLARADRPALSQPRLRVGAAAPPEPVAPLGDELADAWFK
jgi:hypothetical protein